MRSPHIHTLTAHLAAEHRRRDPDPQRITTLRREIRYQQAREYLTGMLAADPRPGPGQLRDLAGILTTAADGGSHDR